MPTYTYSAVSNKGKSVKGKMTALNDLDLEHRIRSLGLEIVNYKALRAGGSRFLGSVKPKDLIMLCLHLEQLDRAGVPLLDSLADMRDSSDSAYMRDLMSDIYENVKNGDMLSEAMRRHHRIFRDVFAGLVAAGEKTGNLSESFKNLADHLKWNNDFRRKIRKAIRYPIALLVIMSGVISMMMMYVVPQLSEFLLAQGFDLPFYTQALISFSGFFSEFWYLIFGLPIIGIAGLLIVSRTSPRVRRAMHMFWLHFPFIGQVILKTNLARFTRFFAITFNSGIDVLECLSTAKKVVSNMIIAEAVASIEQSVSEGNSLTMALQQTQRFPSLVVRMFKVGEDSGNMETALNNVNFFYDREVNDSVESMVGMIQPALTILMGLLMLWVTVAVFGPLYDSFSKLNL
ncbi:MAG: type II secretion system F family protein [Rickettsiales bacterium]|nr:type II secretion system F family protein [Rickettsiales bacterium]